MRGCAAAGRALICGWAARDRVRASAGRMARRP